MTRFMCCWLVLLFCGCQDYETRERELGYKGKARMNPFLAFERFVAIERGEDMVLREGWKALNQQDALLILPSTALTNRELVGKMEQWVYNGGHVVFLLEHAELGGNEWSSATAPIEIPEEIRKLWDRIGITANREPTVSKFTKLDFDDHHYRVDLETHYLLDDGINHKSPFVTTEWGDGCITIISDARMLRNRMIDQAEHATVLAELLDRTREGQVIFFRDGGISFFGMVWERAWMVLIAILLLLGLWLLRHMPRFGPLDAESQGSELRAYDHHLEMIGDFHWRLDHGVSLLQPLRQEAQELCLAWQMKSGAIDHGLFELMAEKSGVPFERVQRAMTERKPADGVVFSRAVADLQEIRKAFL